MLYIICCEFYRIIGGVHYQIKSKTFEETNDNYYVQKLVLPTQRRNESREFKLRFYPP